MVILHKTMYPWRKTDVIGYWDSYNDVVNNFKKACDKKYPDRYVLFLDNTYQNLDQVVEIVAEHDCDLYFIFSLVDPPYTWHYLKEQLLLKFPNKKFVFTGNDHAPDFEINYGFIWFYKSLSTYSINDVWPKEFNYTFLSYNFKPKIHRIELFEKLSNQHLTQFGYYTHPADQKGNPHRFSNSLGDIDIWNQHFLNIVSATVFRLKSEPLYLCEKIFKPIMGLRPFVINGSPRYYHELRMLGFDCFEDIFPVQELEIELDTLNATMDKNHQIICDVIKDLQHKNLHELYQQLLLRLIANRNQWEKICQDLTKKFCIDPIELP